MRLLDTDTCVAILRGYKRAVTRRDECNDAVATTWVTVSELFYGAPKSVDPAANKADVYEFLSPIPILDFDILAAEKFGELKALLIARGERLDDADLFIASVALTRNAILVTGNRKHFDHIPGIQIEDWIRG